MKKFLIGEISNMYDISPDTLRYYSKEGLLPFVKKNAAGRREFTEADLGYLDVIVCLKKSGVPIKEISIFMDWCMQGDKTLKERFEFIEQQEKYLQQKKNELQNQLDFIQWKKWYYKTALEKMTEEIFFIDGTTQVDDKWYKTFLSQKF